MQVKWWHGVVVLGLCAASYTLGRTNVGAETPAQPIIAQQNQPGRTVDAPGPFSSKETSVTETPVTTQDPGRALPQPKSSAPPVSGKAAVEAASRTLDYAINRRVWTNDDAQEFRHAIVDMSAEERDRLIRQLTMAINNGQLTVMVDRGPPF